MVTSAMQCLVLPDDVSFEHGAMHFVNPMTAFGMVERATVEYKSEGIVQTGAASQLGRMVVKVCAQKKIPLINIVRREEQVKLLKDMGAEHVLNSSVEGWEEQLATLSKQLKARVCFECVAGPMTGTIMKNMPFKSIGIVYGALSFKDCQDISPLLFIGRDQRIEGFLLGTYLETKGTFAILRFINQVSKMLQDSTLKSEVAERIPLSKVKESIAKYEENMTAGKYLVFPNIEDQ